MTLATCHKQESRHSIILRNDFRIQYFGAIWSSLKREDCSFTKQGQTQLSSMTHCLQSSLRKRYAWRPKISFMKGRAWFWESVLFSKLIRNVVHKIYLYKKQDHLGNRSKMRRDTAKPDATLPTVEYLYIGLCGENAGCMATKQGHKADGDVRKTSAQGTIPQRHEPKAGDQRVQRGVTTITCRHEPHRDLRTLRKFWKTSMPWLQYFLRNWDHLLQLRKKFEVLAESHNIPEDQLRFYFNPWLCHQEEFQSRSKTRCFWRQVMFYKAKQMLEKATQSKHGNHPTILSKWYEQEEYWKSLAEHIIEKKEVILFDRIALDRHDYTATKAERLQNAKQWILRLNANIICRCIKTMA